MTRKRLEKMYPSNNRRDDLMFVIVAAVLTIFFILLVVMAANGFKAVESGVTYNGGVLECILETL